MGCLFSSTVLEKPDGGFQINRFWDRDSIEYFVAFMYDVNKNLVQIHSYSMYVPWQQYVHELYFIGLGGVVKKYFRTFPCTDKRFNFDIRCEKVYDDGVMREYDPKYGKEVNATVMSEPWALLQDNTYHREFWMPWVFTKFTI